jgi:hypothetical protein
MQKLIAARIKAGEQPGEGRQLREGDLLPRTTRMSMLFDGIKLIGAGNGAGTLGAIAAMYYFSSRPELHSPIKIAAISFSIGVLTFALSITAFLGGLLSTMDFGEALLALGGDATKISAKDLNRAITGMMAIAASIIGATTSWVCFLIGALTVTYMLFRFA